HPLLQRVDRASPRQWPAKSWRGYWTIPSQAIREPTLQPPRRDLIGADGRWFQDLTHFGRSSRTDSHFRGLLVAPLGRIRWFAARFRRANQEHGHTGDWIAGGHFTL